MSDDLNPYQQPEADVVKETPAAGALTLGGPNKVSVGQAVGWIGDGMKMLSGPWGVVIGALVVTFVITMVLQFIPFIGPLAQPFLMVLLYAGLVKMFHRIDTSNQSEFADLFAGFSERTGPLILLALAQLGVYVVFGLLIAGLALMFAGAGAFSASQGMDPAMMNGGLSAALLVLVPVFLVLTVLVAFLFYFTVPLVMLTDLGPGKAMALSFKACLRNLLPIIVYGIVVVVIVAVAALPFLLGWLFVMPIMAGAYYLSFKQVLTEQA